MKDKKNDDERQSSLEDYFGSVQEEEDTKEAVDRTESTQSPTKESSPSHSKKDTSGTAVFMDESSLEEEESDEEEEFVVPVRIGHRELPQDLPPSYLLSIDYSGPDRKAIARLYRPDTKELFFWLDDTGHQPYCYTDLPQQAVESDPGISRHGGFVGTEVLELRDLLRDQTRNMTKVIATDPLSIGGGRGAIREYLGHGTQNNHAWEATIRYRNSFTYDSGLVPGLMYKIESGSLVECPPKLDEATLEAFEDTIQDDPALSKMVSEYAPLFFTEVPDIRRIALDIEVYTPVKNRVPDANTAPYQVTAIGLSDNEGLNKCFVLERPGHPAGEKRDDFPKGLELVFYKDEAEMIIDAFKTIDRYPVVLTFVGDAFDLKYLLNRAKKLNVDMDRYCPLYEGGETILLQRGIHVDLYRFLENPSIRLYALSGAYERSNLESIAQALLGIGKLDLSTEIADLPYYELAHYCWLDANITLQITQYNSNLVLRLIILLMRISRLSMEDLTRQRISSWLQSLFRQEHRSQGALIPRRSDIEELKSPDAHTEAIIGGKSFKGAIVIEPVAGVHFNATVLDFASLYPSIMKTYNISYETVDCLHEECRTATDNRVPETDHWICKKNRGMVSQTIGFFRDARVKWFKKKSKDEDLQKTMRDWYTVVEKALKVFVNACLPYDEEVIVCDHEGNISKIHIGSLSENWQSLRILSIDHDWDSPTFGKSVFVPIKGFKRSGKSEILSIRLRDGRTIRCTSNHVLPKLLHKHTRTGRKRIAKEPLKLIYVAAEDLQVDDNLLIHTRTPLTSNPPKTLFIPDYIETDTLHVGIKRRDYRKYSYRTTQKCDHPVINIINEEFRYSKGSKWYRAKWDSLSDSAKEILQAETSKSIPLYGKLIENSERWREAGKWFNLQVDLDDDFFELMGWYLSEGNTGVNRINISQYLEANSVYFHEIGSLLTRMKLPFAVYREKDYVIHSKVLAVLIESLCGISSENKMIPIELLDSHRAQILLDAFFKGDGNINRLGARRYSTSSRHLASDLLVLLGSLGIHASVHNEENMYRVVERKGLKYTRTGRGLIDFHGTYPVRIRSIETSSEEVETFDLETENGLFVATHGVVVHNSYGVTGAQHFELFCMPAAESVTAYGRHAIIKTKEKAESMGVRVLYGDSVLPNTPVVIRHDGLIRVIPIEDIHWSKSNSNVTREIKQDIEVWTEKGWSRILYSYRHKVKKRGFRILTDKGFVETTEDHSLVINGEEVSPSSLKEGDFIERYETKLNGTNDVDLDFAWLLGMYVAEGTSGRYGEGVKTKRSWRIANQDRQLLERSKEILWRLGFPSTIVEASDGMFYLSAKYDFERIIQFFDCCHSNHSREKIVPDFILDASMKAQEAFLEGYLAGDGHESNIGITSFGSIDYSLLQGLCMILTRLGHDYYISTRPDKLNFIRVRIRKTAPRKRYPMQILSIEEFDIDGYVYDLETENHHFCGGIGGVLLHNTDSVFLDNPSKEQQEELVAWSRKELGIDLEVEKTYKYVALSERKKNYIGVYQSGYVEVKGLSGKKRNTPDFAQDAFRKMLEVLSKVDDPEGFEAAKDEIREVVNHVLDRLENKAEPYSPEDLAYRIQMKKSIDQYGSTKPQHVRAAMMLRAAGYEVPAGTIVEYIKVRGPDDILPVQLAQDGNYWIDKDKYIDTLRSVFEQVLDSVGIDFEELLGFTTLDQFF